MKQPRDLTGKQFGSLTVMRFAGKDARGNRDWQCKCSCGNSARIRGSSLLRGDTRSCGCHQRGRRRPRIGPTFGGYRDFDLPDDPMEYQP